MAHGTRGRWLRVATTGFGVVLCTGLAGCMNTDKPKETKATPKLPPPGLTGTPMLSGGAGAGALSRTGQPTGQFVGNGANLVPGGGVQPAGGSSFAGQRYPSNGLNTNTTGQPPAYNYAAAPGAPGFVNAPTQPGYVPPSAQPLQTAGASAPSQYLGGGAAPGGPGYTLPPADGLIPPLPPPAHGSAIGAEPAGGVMPPVPLGPMPPLMPTPPPGATGKVPPLSNYASDVFGPK